MTVPDVRNIDDVLASFDQLWAPRVLADVNDWSVRLVKVQGEFVWHRHDDTDELFVVLDGELVIDVRDGDEVAPVRLGRHDVYVVPRGVEHRPRSEPGAHILLLEPADVVNTGDQQDIPDHVTSTRGIRP